MLSNQSTIRKSIWLAWFLLSVGLIATIVATIYVKMDVEADAKRQFDFACSQIQHRIGVRMDAHAQILTSAAALFDASDVVTREDWHAYTRRQKVDQQLPGIQGIGFSMVIPRERLEEHIQEIRNQGFPDYNVKPEGDRETYYTSIVYLEPFSERNLRAFGYDMFSEPVRRIAMERSRDLDRAVLSGKVILVQEIDQDVQAGTLMYVPVYRKGLTTDSVADRRAALYGWVYSPYRMKDLMQGVLKGWDLEEGKQIRLQIFDNEQLSTDSLLYDSQPKKEIETVNASRLTLQTHTDFNEHIWFLRFSQTDVPLYYGRVYGVFFGGSMISLLLFGLLISLLNTRFRAQQLADQLTVDLRESEEKYRIIFNNQIYAICIFDLETLRLLDVNDAYTRLYGYSREELISGMTIHDITAEHQVSDAATKQAIHEGTIFIPLRYHQKKDGSVFPVEIVGGPYEWKGQKVMFALAHDISDRRRLEEALLKGKQLYDNLVSNIPVGVYIMRSSASGAFAFDYVSPKVAEIFNVSAESFLSDPQVGFQPIHPDDLDALVKLNQERFQQPHPFNWEGRAIVNGALKWLNIASSPELLENGEVLWHGVITDISARKCIEEENAKLESQNRQLQKAESLNRMAGAIAHHFNNQLQAVMGNLELAMDDLPLGLGTLETLTEALKAARKAADVSRLMLIYLGQTPGEHEPINLSETCSKGMTLLQTATPKGIIINAEFPSSGPIIRANAGQIQQVMTNLVTNAWESISDNRGTIGLTVKTVSWTNIPTSKRFPIDWQPQSIPYACVEVADNGCGFSNKDIEKLFDPFFTTKFTGRGLGLPVVMGIVKAHGGGVTLESEPGQGSTFRIFLPVSTEKLPIQHDLPVMSEALPTSKTQTLSKIESGGTVLLIEDEEQVRNMAKMMLTRLGYTVLESKDGIEAVEIFRQHLDKICCVLSDLTMPRMDGWDTLAALRKLSPGIPVVLSSGYDEAQVMAGEHPERPNAFLGKPYQLKGLRETINRILINQS
ncbi:MAG: CHASE domain-containing protein [Pseudomonadota bacterium]